MVSLAATAATAMAGIASANTGLTSGTLVAGSTPQTYTYSTSTDYWSVVGLQPSASADFDFSLLDGATGASLATSAYGTGRTDFVAVDSNSGTRPFGSYNAAVTQYLPGGSYWIQAYYGASIITLPPITHQGTSGAGDSDIAFANLNSNNIISVADIYLTAGQSFWAVSPDDATELYLLEANPATPSTYVQSRATAGSLQSTKAVDNCTLYTAKVAGWHALVLVGDRAPTITNPLQGIGIGLHRFDPSQPNYCAIADFPGPTP